MAGLDSSRVDFVGLNEFQRRLKRLEPETTKSLKKRFKQIAAAVGADAKRSAGWSSRIPGTIRPTVTRRGIGLKAGGRKAPHARGFELGSAGNPSALRHPLFGDKNHWFSTPVRPYLFPAVDKNRDRAVQEAAQAVEEAARKVGW